MLSAQARGPDPERPPWPEGVVMPRAPSGGWLPRSLSVGRHEYVTEASRRSVQPENFGGKQDHIDGPRDTSGRDRLLGFSWTCHEQSLRAPQVLLVAGDRRRAPDQGRGVLSSVGQGHAQQPLVHVLGRAVARPVGAVDYPA